MNKRILKGAALVCALLLLLSSAVGCKKKTEEVIEEDELEVGGKPRLGFAVEGVGGIANTQDEFDAMLATAEAAAEDQGYTLNYQNEAVSTDGMTFSCNLGNDGINKYPMYIQLYGDLAMSDELFMSDLIMPGQAFQSITLNHALNPGVHDVICAFTWVKIEDNGDQSVHNQITVKLMFTVSEPS